MTASAKFDLGILFLDGASLPDQVFRDPARLGFLFADSAILTADDLWPVLRDLAGRFRDEVILAKVVRDHQSEGGRGEALPLASFDPHDGAEQLRRWLDYRGAGRPEPLYVYADVVALWGSSGLWGLWCDQAHELAVLGIPSSELGPIRDQVESTVDWPWYEAGGVGELLAPAFHPDPVPKELIRRIRGSFAVARL